MNIMTTLTTFLQRDLYIFGPRDIIEIFFLATVIYYTQQWLKKDLQKNLLSYFYGYCGIHLVAYYAQLTTLTIFLLVTAPIGFILFIIMHQDILQKNLITLKRMQTPQATFDWFNEFTRSTLAALNNQKEIIYVIERSDSLSDIIFSGCSYYADIQKDSMELFLEKHIGGSNAFIWINREGKLIAINATWQIQDTALWVTPEVRAINKWKQDAIHITSKTDSLIFKTDPINRTFDLVIQGKLLEEVVPEATINLLKRYIVDKSQKQTKESFSVGQQFIRNQDRA